MSAPHHLALSIPEEALRAFVLSQRWFGSKSREPLAPLRRSGLVKRSG